VTFLPLLIELLEFFMWKCPQLVWHDLLDIVHSSKMKTFEVEFEFRGGKEVTRTQIRRVWGLLDYWNALLGQKFVQSHYFLDTPRTALEHVWKEEVVTAYFEIFTWDLPEETEKCYERHRARK
jgi:hypothetical protein